MLQEFLLGEYLSGPLGLGNENITGFFIDDYWCFGPSCHDPVPGPSEFDKYNQLDMGLTDADVQQISEGWRENMDAAHEMILKLGGFAWDLFPNQHNAGCSAGPAVVKTSCVDELRQYCRASPVPKPQSGPLYYGLTTGAKIAGTPIPLPDFMQDLVNFLLIRGPYAWIGYGFVGCNAGLVYNRPKELDTDYGAPLGLCAETASGSGVFKREYTKATVTMDCKSWKGKLEMK
jgi:hypothetical protein